MELEAQRLKETWIHKDHPALEKVNSLLKMPLTREASLADLVKRPEVTYNDLTAIDGLAPETTNTQAHEQVGALA